jgi:hypothetical protein
LVFGIRSQEAKAAIPEILIHSPSASFSSGKLDLILLHLLNFALFPWILVFPDHDGLIVPPQK